VKEKMGVDWIASGIKIERFGEVGDGERIVTICWSVSQTPEQR